MANTTAKDGSDTGAEISQALIDLVHAQTQHSLEIVAALATAVDWDRVFQIEGEFLRESMDRAGQLTKHYLEAARAMLDAAADDAGDQARTAA